MRSAYILLGLLAVCAGMPALAQVNKWVDEKGQVQYGDRPPAQKSSGSTQLQKAPPSNTSKAASKKPVPLAVQPKLAVPGDPLIERMKANEERKQIESASADCWRSGGSDCDDPGAMRYKLDAEAKAKAAAAKKPATQKPASREPLPADFCARNPKVQGC